MAKPTPIRYAQQYNNILFLVGAKPLQMNSQETSLTQVSVYKRDNLGELMGKVRFSSDVTMMK